MNTVYATSLMSLLLIISFFKVNAQLQDLSGQWISNKPIVFNNHEIKAFMLNGTDDSSMNKQWKREGMMCERFDDPDRWALPSSFHYFVDRNKIGFQVSFSAAGIAENSTILLEYQLLDQDTLILTFGYQTAVYKRKSVGREMRI